MPTQEQVTEALRAVIDPELRRSIVASLGRVEHAPADDRFTPHVTLGRIKDGRGRPPDLTGPLAQLGGEARPSFEVSEVVVFASSLGRDGPSYTPLAHAPFKG